MVAWLANGSDDCIGGRTMTKAMIPDEFKAVERASVRIRRNVAIGSESVVLPGVTLDEGVAVGALSLVRDIFRAFANCAGLPARTIGERYRDLLSFEARFRAWS